MHLDHVALLVPELEPALEALQPHGLTVGPIEDFPGEGTREVYLGEAGRPARLLLMQSLGGTGPYARALEKRGPGLHHVALRHPDLDAFLTDARGWLLHPRSFKTRANSNTIWLARPGVGCLLEVHQSTPDAAGDPVLEAVEVPGLEERMQVANGLTPGATARLRIGGAWIEASL